MSSFILSSPAFEDDGSIPDQYGYTEANVNPPLAIQGLSADPASLTLIMDDPDAREAAGKIWNHWLVWNIDPDRTEIPEDWTPQSATEGQNDYGEQGYGGPNPPDGEHTYRFRLYALDTPLDLQPSATKDDLVDAMTGHIVDKARLNGTYEP